jgi:hypothetical protein
LPWKYTTTMQSPPSSHLSSWTCAAGCDHTDPGPILRNLWFLHWAHLVEKETEFVRFTDGDLANPGAFHWTKPLSLSPEKPHYAGKIVILVDESSMSQAEYTSMAFRSAYGAIVIGSTTSGADGNVSPFLLPGAYTP